MEDKELIELAKVNPEKFGELYEKYVDDIYRYVYRRTSQKESAEDITSHVFFDAITAIKTYEYRGVPFICWLYRIARNHVISWYRQNQRHNIVAMDESYIKPEAPIQKKQLQDEEVKNEIKRALETMEESDKEIITLKYFEELSNQEIASILGISANHVGVKLFRALKKLRNKLTSYL